MLGSISPRDGAHRLSLYVEPYHWFGEVALLDDLPRSKMRWRAPIVPCWWYRVPDRSLVGCPPSVLARPGAAGLQQMRLMLTALEDNATLPIDQQLARRLLFSVTNFGQATADRVRRRVGCRKNFWRACWACRANHQQSVAQAGVRRVLALHYAEIGCSMSWPPGATGGPHRPQRCVGCLRWGVGARPTAT